MRKILRISLLSLLLISLGACKQDTKEAEEVTSEIVKDSMQTQVRKNPTEETIRRSNSVMARIMITTECNLFSRYLITARLSDSLLLGKGPYTVFAPESEAFKALDETYVEGLPLQENRQELVSLLQGHMIQGNLDSASITKQLQIGSVTVETMSGSQLRIRKSGSDILLTDEQGNTAKVGKSDILGVNGLVHVIDKVLQAD